MKKPSLKSSKKCVMEVERMTEQSLSSHWPSKVLPQSMITVECMTSKDFPLENEHSTKDNNGCACFPLQKAWVFLDNIISRSNICEEDIVEGCWHCKHCSHVDGDCYKNISSHVKVYAQEISRVTVHELMHLFECTDEQISNIEREITPFWYCPFMEAMKE